MRADPDGVLLGAAAGPLPVSRPLPLRSLSYQRLAASAVIMPVIVLVPVVVVVRMIVGGGSALTGRIGRPSTAGLAGVAAA